MKIPLSIFFLRLWTAGGKKNFILVLWLKESLLSSIAWWIVNVDEERQKSVYSLLNLNINFNSCNRLTCTIITMHIVLVQYKKYENGKEIGKISSYRDDVIRKNYVVQGSWESFSDSMQLVEYLGKNLCSQKLFTISTRKDFQSTCIPDPFYFQTTTRS